MSVRSVPHPALGVAILVVGLLTMLVVLRAVTRRLQLHPEVSRKVAHVSLGLATLSFPWLFRSVWPVLLVCGLACLTLLALRYVPVLREHVGGVVNGVKRASFGDLYFPVAAAGLFVLSRGDRVLFSLPLLTLAFADAVAALVGVNYGQVAYSGGEGKKSLEGSIAFFIVAFFTTHIPLLLFTRTGRAESLLIGLTFGVLVMLLEAIAWRGLDNLFIPFGGFLLLRAFLALDAKAMIARLTITLVLLALVLVLRKRRTLTDAAVLAGVLIGYVAWSVGGWPWLVPPLVLFLAYTLLWPRAAQLRERPHDMIAIFSVTGCGLLWLLLATVLQLPALYYAYTLSFAANLCFIGVTWWRDYRRHSSLWRGIILSAIAAWIAFFLPYIGVLATMGRLTGHGAVHALFAMIPLWLGGAALVFVIPRDPRRASQQFPWMRQALLSLAASTFGLLVLLGPSDAGLGMVVR